MSSSGATGQSSVASLLALRRTARRVARSCLRRVLPSEGEAWDRDAGVQTEQWAQPADLTVPVGSAAEGHIYVPTRPRLIRAWLHTLAEPLVRSSTFIDMGSGRGRVLLMAAERPFRRVVGVEFAAELHEACLDNVSRFPVARMRCRDVTSVLGDAGDFEFPPEPLVVYFDNPFSEQVMARVLENLAWSHEQHPRSVVVVYQQLREEPASSSTSNLALLDQQPFLTGRTLPFRFRDRLLLSPFIVRVYSSPSVQGGHHHPYPTSAVEPGHERSTTRRGPATQEGQHHPFGDHGEPTRR